MAFKKHFNLPLKLNKKQFKKIRWLFVLIISFFFIYWLKSNARFNLLESFSVSDYWPFKFFYEDQIISQQTPGVLFSESFDSLRIFDRWPILWMKEEGRVIKDYDKKGIANSRCLIIRSRSEKTWSCSYNALVEVNRGDIFSFKGNAKLTGDKLTAYAGVAAFDREKNAVEWNYITEKIETTGEWSAFEKSFSVTDDSVSFIRFRVSGKGIGEFRFDNVSFIKEKHQTP